MEGYNFKAIARVALKETLEAVRLDKPVRWVVAIGTPMVGGGLLWLLTEQVSLTATAAFAALMLIGALIFLGKLISVPLALAARTERTRLEAEASLGDRIAALENQKANERDPDAIYQLGVRAATVRHPTVIRQRGIVHFDAILDAADLNQRADFEYRDFVLRIASSDGGMMARMGNAREDVTIGNAICEIVRLRQP